MLMRFCFPIVLLAVSTLAQDINEVTLLPLFLTHPRGGVYNRDQSVTLNCDATNDNQPLQFSRNGVLIAEGDPAYSIGVTSIEILRLTEGLAGEYVCIARNKVGNRTFTIGSVPAFIQLRVFEVNLFSSSPTSPHNVTVTAGHPIVLNCAANYISTPAPTFAWSVQVPFPRTLRETDHAVVGLNGSLFIQSPSVSNLPPTVFKCSLTNDNMVQVGYIRLIVEASSVPTPPPQLLSAPRDVYILPGTTSVTLECIVGGDPLVAVTWTTSPNIPTTSLAFENNNNRLVVFASISPLEDGVHTGTYTCSVPTVGNFSAVLRFLSGPRITSNLPGTTRTLRYGSSLSFSCTSDAIAISSYWYHNGKRLTQFNSSQLDIPSLVEEDTGSYQCLVLNDAGNALSQTYVQVQTIGANFQQDLPAQQVVFGDSLVQLNCSADGAPPPTYQWLKEGIPLSDTTGTVVINSTTGTLKIVNAEETHSGSYTCRATNRIADRVIGEDETSTMLTVITPTTFTKPPVGERMRSIQLATDDTLFCEVSSDSGSTLTFSWTKDGEPLVLDSPRVFYNDSSLTRNGNIRITNVLNEDRGVYVCTVTTTYNGRPAPTIVTGPIQVTVSDRPVAPSITMVTSLTSTSVRIVWIITSNPDRIRLFTIQIRPSSMTTEESWTSLERSPNAVTSIDVNEGLVPFTRYDVRVSATYINGESTSSDIVEVTTLEALPGGPPEEVVTKADSDTNLQILWRPPSQPNGVITNYTILYRVKNGPTSNLTAVVNGNTTSYLLKNLKEGETYTVLVAASNSVGMGPFSSETLGITGKGALTEPEGPFYQTVWFIVVIIVVVVILIVSVVILFLVVRYKRSHQPTTGKYHVRPQSGYFGGGGPGVGDMTDDVANDYMKRSTEMNAFGSPTNSEHLDAILERETVATTLTDRSLPYPSSHGTPVLVNGPRYTGFGAPEYINPPSFSEAIRSRTTSRSSRPHSGASHTEKAPSEWSASHNSRTAFISYEDPYEKKHLHHHHGGGEESGPDSSYSVQTFSDGDSEMTEGTEYSHLAAAGQIPRTYHHLQVQTQQNATLV